MQAVCWHMARDSKGLPWWFSDKESACNAGEAGDMGLIPRLGRSPGERHDNPLRYSYLENPMDRGAWWATVHRIAKRRTRLKQLSMHDSEMEAALSFPHLHLQTGESSHCIPLKPLNRQEKHSQCAGEELEAPEGEVDLSKPSSQNEGLRPNLWAPRPVLLCVLLWCFWMKLNQSAISQPFSSPALGDQLRFPLSRCKQPLGLKVHWVSAPGIWVRI